jgi:hypothetical protein
MVHYFTMKLTYFTVIFCVGVKLGGVQYPRIQKGAVMKRKRGIAVCLLLFLCVLCSCNKEKPDQKPTPTVTPIVNSTATPVPTMPDLTHTVAPIQTTELPIYTINSDLTEVEAVTALVSAESVIDENIVVSEDEDIEELEDEEIIEHKDENDTPRTYITNIKTDKFGHVVEVATGTEEDQELPAVNDGKLSVTAVDNTVLSVITDTPFSANTADNTSITLDIAEQGIQNKHIANKTISAEKTKAYVANVGDSSEEVWVFYCGTSTDLV